MNRDELLCLLETFDRLAPTSWYAAQYKDFPANKFIMGDFTKDSPSASATDSPSQRASRILPMLEVIWPGFDFCAMISEIRNNLPQLIQFLKEPNWNPSIPGHKCVTCNHWKWQHLHTWSSASINCIDSWTPETGGCRCAGFKPD